MAMKSCSTASRRIMSTGQRAVLVVDSAIRLDPSQRFPRQLGVGLLQCLGLELQKLTGQSPETPPAPPALSRPERGM